MQSGGSASSSNNNSSITTIVNNNNNNNRGSICWDGPPAHFMLPTHAIHCRHSRSIERCPRACKGKTFPLSQSVSLSLFLSVFEFEMKLLLILKENEYFFSVLIVFLKFLYY